ncbi:MAG: tripartite tricarboxylate transporter substrate binding protein [Rubripirellula sp.]|nr:tripartite tricarboxylate transporter substrate binding protein [Rubripirellula sp.]
MKASWILWHVTSSVAILFLVGWWAMQVGVSAGSPYPNQPIQVVVPYAAGGGSDTFVRILSRGIVEEKRLPVPLVIINQDGGIGTIGSREVKDSDPDGYKILCHHNAIITAKLVGTVDYGPEAFEPIAMTGEMSMVILVRGDSPYQTVADLLGDAKDRPQDIRFAANKGAPAYFATLQLEKTLPGAELRIVSSGGGADRYAKILGGHLDAGIFSLSEYLDFRRGNGTPADQDVRAIALLGTERHESIPDVPTATEMGSPVLLSNANYWWAPQGTPSEVVDYLADLLKATMEDETVRSELQRIRVDPTYDRGESLQQRVNQTVQQFESVAEQKPASLPDFSLYLGVILAGLFVWMLLESLVGKSPVGDSISSRIRMTLRPRVALASLIVLCGYVLLLGMSWLPFAPLTAAMVVTLGGTMMIGSPESRSRNDWLVLLQLGLLTGFGVECVFSLVLATPLP